MSVHPNVILMVRFTPHDMSRKTMQAILGEPYSRDHGQSVKIGDADYAALLMESDYDEGFQIGGREGDLVFYELVTYGYGETIEWSKLAAMQQALEVWAKETATSHHCDYEIHVTANYW